jgi:catechol 2,3-dioxygenase-like lactoylglutathione lyase family enzyme
MMHASTTVFTVRDLQASLTYYRDKLGFEVAFQYGEPAFYAGLFSGQVRLHLIAADHAPRPPGHGAVAIDVDDVEALHAGLAKRGAKILKAPANQPYGLRDCDVADLDGNMLFFAMEIPKG